MDGKRKFLRFDVPLSMEVKLTPQSQDYIVGVVNNFSRQGLGFVVQNSSVQPRGSVDLKLRVPSNNETTHAMGDVVWTKPQEDKMHVGIKLTSMDKAAKWEILEYAYNQWRKTMEKRQ